MAEQLLSVGIDVGTTTTQLVVSRLTAENRAGAFAVPRMEITHRQVVYESSIHFTPLLSGELVDANGIRDIVAAEYEKAGIRRQDVDTGAIIITGETSRKENAAAVLSALSDFAGDFVVATAGPDLESILAAKGSGAVEESEKTGKILLHMDIGGGTSNLALIKDGKILTTACMNVGGRLMKFSAEGKITYISPVLEGHVPYKVGDMITQEQAEVVADMLAGVLEAAAGLSPKTEVYHSLITVGTQPPGEGEEAVISFSGGVADCIQKELPWLEFGDLGPLLGKAIRKSRLCRGAYRLGSQTIRATVIGAGCHSTQLSGSTVYLQNVTLPVKNLPVAVLPMGQWDIRQRLEALESWGVLALSGWKAPDYATVCDLADRIAAAVGDRPCYVALEEDMAKALGHALALRLPKGAPCLCIDGVHVPQGSYLDVGAPAGPAYPVVIKTLVFSRE